MFPKKFLHPLLLSLVFVALSIGVLSAQDEDGYVIPDLPEGADPATVIATVGDTEITLEDFVERVRYLRFVRFDQLALVAEQAGPGILVLDDPANQYAPQISQFLQVVASTQSFYQQIYRSLILENLYHQEFVERGLEIDECVGNQVWMTVLFDPTLQVTECEFAEGFEAAQQEFVDRATTFSGMTEEEVRNLIQVQAEFDAIFNALGEEVEVEDVETITTSHIRVFEDEAAQAVMDALEAGEDWYSVMFEYTEDENVQGSGGALPPLQRGQTVPEFDAAIFAPETEVGDLLGPIQTQFGYHIIEILGQEAGAGRRVSHILFSTENSDATAAEGEANTAIELLSEEGVDFATLAARYSDDPLTANQAGDLGYLEPDNARMPEAFNEAVFNAEAGEIIGPIETELGYHVAVVTEAEGGIASVTARHILVEDEAFSQELLERINAGEDFAELANLYSLDGAGNRGDTYTILTGGQASGAYTREELFEQVPALALALAGTEVGQIVGPVNTEFGYFIARVEDISTRPPSEQERGLAVQEYVDTWQVEQLATELEEVSEVWRQYEITSPMPSDVAPELAEIDVVLDAMRANAEEIRVANSIPNVLTRLTVRTPVAPEVEVTPDMESTAESTPEMSEEEVEVTPEMTPEATPESTEEAAG